MIQRLLCSMFVIGALFSTIQPALAQVNPDLDESYAEFHSEGIFHNPPAVKIPKGFLCERIVSGREPLNQMSDSEINYEVQRWQHEALRRAFDMFED